MAPGGRKTERGLSADEFSARFQAGARVLWTLAAGLLGDPTEAEDVCQEAFLAAYAKRGQFEPGTNFMAWMGRFIRNVTANELRKRARRATVSTDPEVLARDVAASSSATEAPSFEPEQFDQRLVAGLHELGDVPRSCLLLRTLQELSYAEIATLLELPEGTAMSHVHRARLALRQKLAPTLDGVRP
jgi:RNA polymerase sigma-70 factor (ECF subfamily)